MTLNRYLFGQDEPQRFPTVVLQKDEFKILWTIKIGSKVLSSILITDLPAEYVKVKGENQLYTADRDGNPKSKSVFHIPAEL